MGNLPSNHANPSGVWQPSSEDQKEREAHRDWIKGRAFTLLSHYWRDDDPEHLLAALGEDWADVLEGIPQEFVQKACIRYQQEEPRRKPTPGAIYERARASVPSPRIVSSNQHTTENRRSPCDRETAQRIVEEAGFAQKRFGGDIDE